MPAIGVNVLTGAQDGLCEHVGVNAPVSLRALREGM